MSFSTQKKTGKFPIKLRVVFKSAPKDYQTIYELTEEEYEKLSAPRVSKELHEVREKLKEIKANAEAFIKDIDPFSFTEFETGFVSGHALFRKRNVKITVVGNEQAHWDFDYTPYLKRFPIFQEDHSRPGSISIVFLSYIKKLLQEERIGSAFNYQDTYNSIKKFRGNVLFADITVSFLVQYEQWMKKRGRAKATVGIKLRPLRSIFNEAIELGIIKKDKCYPFGRCKYSIPTGRNNKRALLIDQIKQIYYAELDCPDERKARDFWLFMYFGNGMNPKDFIHLKNKNIKGDYLEFIRAKTERTTREDPKPITVYINADMHDIITRWGNKDKSAESYLFPIMDNTFTPLEQFNTSKSLMIYVNERMKRIAERLGIEKKVTTMVSRHSFSTQLKRSGVSTEYIQEALGHTDKRTTENYLDSFEYEVKKEFASLLTSFKNN